MKRAIVALLGRLITPGATAVAIVVGFPTVARAQDVSSAEAPAEVSDDDFPSAMVVAERDTPEPLLEDVRGFLAEACQLVDAEGYEREARSRGIAPQTPEAMAQILPEMHPGLDLVIVVGANRRTRATLVSLRYYDRFGFQILEEEHSIRGNLMTDESRARVLAEVRLGLAVITRPQGGLSELGGGVAPGEATPTLAVHVGIQAGAGFGTRELSVDPRGVVLGLGTAFFPAAAVQLAIDVEPVARGQLTLGADAEYLTSFGLVTSDRRVDGTIRETSSRSQRIAAGVRLHYRLETSLEAISLGAGLSWSALTFSSEAPVSLPDYTLQGPVLTLSVIIPVAGRFLTFTLAPEAQWIVDVGGALAALGVGSTGAAVGGSARVRLRILEDLFADVTYRESHAFLSAESGSGGSDVERFGIVRLVYAR